jgi:hypothetical protein
MKSSCIWKVVVVSVVIGWWLPGRAHAQGTLADLLDKEAATPPTAAGSPDPAPQKGVGAEPRRAPTPAASDTRKAVAAIQEIFRAEYAAATTPANQKALAQHLTAQAGQAKDLVEKWALLTEAARMAVDAGDVGSVFAIIDSTVSVYEVDAQQAKLDAIAKLVPKVGPEALENLVLETVRMTRQLVSQGELTEAKKLAVMAGSLVRKSRNRPLTTEVNQLTILIREAQKTAKDRDVLMEKLAEMPDDPKLASEAGSFFCFRDGDWNRGLPYLAKGSDAKLAALAKDDLLSAGDAAAAGRLGDAWWEWAEGQKADARVAGRQRALAFYEKAMPQAQGLERMRLEKRIQEAEGGGLQGKQIGFLADLPVARKNGLNFFALDGRLNGKPVVCGDRQWAKGIIATPLAAGTDGVVAYAIPAGAKRLVGKAGVYTRPAGTVGFEIRVDGPKVWASRQIDNPVQVESFDIPIYGAKEVVLVTTCTNRGNANTVWLDPAIAY